MELTMFWPILVRTSKVTPKIVPLDEWTNDVDSNGSKLWRTGFGRLNCENKMSEVSIFKIRPAVGPEHVHCQPR